MIIPLKEPFHFESAVTSHGWWMLAPNHWDEEKQIFYRTLKLNTGKNVLIAVTYTDEHLSVQIKNDISSNNRDREEIKKHVTWMFRLNEDFKPFYAMSQEFGELLHLATERKGRLLRSPTLFEDVVKVILTTNTSWQQTVNMTNNLVNKLGETVTTANKETFKTFPTAEKILEVDEEYLKEHVRVGYRSAYLIDAAIKTLDDSFDLESFKSPAKEIAQLKDIKGVGPYALSTLSMLLGKYDSLPIDSVYKEHVTNKYFNGITPNMHELKNVYDKWGDYKHLAYWFDA